jgi:bifunctional DNase/RNase
LNAEVVKISICDLQDNIYYASITLKVNGRIVEIDSRPSDAIALAVRTKSPIFAEDWILKEIKEEAPEDERESFRKFLEGLSPEDFKYKH